MLHEASPRHARALAASFVALLAMLALAGCEPSDPLEALRQQQAAGDFAGTIEPLRELLVVQPKDPETNVLYGRALVYTGQPGLATWALRQAMLDPTWRATAALELAQAALYSGDFNEAVDVTTELLEDDPDDLVALLYRAQANAHWKKDPDAALEDAERVLELQPERIEAYEPLILALLSLERHTEATEALEEAGRRLASTDPPERVLAWHCSTTAIFAAEGGDMERARELWDECLDQHPADSEAVSNGVAFYEAMGDRERSLAVVRRAYDEQPTNRAFRVALADRLRFSGEVAEGEALLREATNDPSPQVAAGAWYDLARYRHGMLEHGAAADALERCIERTRETGEVSPQLLFEYADALVVSGQLDRALQVAPQITVAAQRKLIEGRVAQERGDATDALVLFDEALRVWPNNAVARYYAGDAAEQLGDFDRALEEYRYSIRISVGETDARTRAARLLIAEKQPRLAYQLIFVEAEKFRLDPEGELVALYLLARLFNPKQLQASLLSYGAREPARLPLALVRGAEGVADRSGPKAALDLLRGAPGIDYTDASAAPVLRALVRYAHAADQREEARKAADAALGANPEAAFAHEIRGLDLELAGDPAAALAAYERAVQLDPQNAGALAGLGRLGLEGEPARALGFFDRAVLADPTDPEPKLAAARALRAAGEADQARQRLDALLDEHPFEAEAAAELAAIDLDRGVATARTLDAARRAARFGGSAEAYEQLSLVYSRLEQPADAREAASRADALRRQQDPVPEEPEADG